MQSYLTDEQLAKIIGCATPKQLEEIRLKIISCLDIANKNMPQAVGSYKVPRVTFDLRGVVAGRANGELIRLNPDLLHDHYEEMINQVIPHEVAHVIEYQKYGYGGHKENWVRIMHMLGVPANRTHNMPAKKARVHPRPYQYRCDCRVHKVTKLIHRRIQNGQWRTCTRCRGIINKDTFLGEGV